ncbi:MAG: T9SS type A sorting domain-containing protein [Deltaproteobacteria bacterium]
MYPNPASEIVKLKFDSKYLSEKNITVQNSAGMILRKEICDKDHYDLDLSSYKVGIYFITVQTDKDLQTVKFIKI